MNELTIINGKALPLKEHDGQRVVTFKEIDFVHGRPEERQKGILLATRNDLWRVWIILW